MSNTQGETTGRRWIGMTVAAIVTAAVVGGIGVTLVNANAAAQAHTALMVEVRADGKTLTAAATEDAALAATAVEAGQNTHIQAVAAEQVAVKVAAEQAAIAETNRIAAEQAAAQAAAQQAAQKQVARQQTATDDGPPASTGGGLPAGSPVPKIADGSEQGFRWDTQACASHNASGNPAVCD